MKNCVTKIFVRDDVVLITVKKIPSDIGIIAKLFEALAQRGVNLDLISQTPPDNQNFSDVSFSIVEKDLSAALELAAQLQKKKPDIKIDAQPGHTKIALYGEAFRDQVGVAAEIFRAAADAGVDVKLITTSEVDVSILINQEDVDTAMAKFKEVFGVDSE